MLEIYLKEIRELLRDRKTLIFTILLPIFIIPLLGLGFGALTATLFNSAMNEEYKYAMVGAQHAPALAEHFAGQKQLHLVELGPNENIATAIAQDRIKFALVVPAGFRAAVDSHAQAKLELHYNNAGGSLTLPRVQAVIDTYNDQLRDQALPALKLDKQQVQFVAHPIAIEEHSTANLREQIGAAAGGLLPYLLLIVCLTAAMYPAIDLAAGEKERGTLETLLLAPVPLRELVLAKFLVLFTFGMTSALLLLASLAGMVAVFGVFFRSVFDEQVISLIASFGVLDLAMLGLMLAPVAAMFAAILLTISVYARSFKEATGMMTPLTMLMLLPISLAPIPGVELNWWWASVPVTNIALAIKELVKGTLHYQFFGVILLSSCLIAGGLLAFCQWMFSREEVLFRD